MRKFAIVNTCGSEECGNHEQDMRGAYYLVQDVDTRIERYEDLLRRSGIAVSCSPGPERDAFVWKLLTDMHELTTEVAQERKALGL